MLNAQKSIQVLVAEDDADDRLLVESAFLPHITGDDKLHFFVHGQELLEFLKAMKVVDFVVIILDLNMPVMNGKETLKFLKSSKEYKHIPVITLTTSSEEEDVEFCYNEGVNAYLVKPSEYHDLEELVLNFIQFWKRIQLP